MSRISNYNFSGKRVLLRVDFNVPLNEAFEITDDTRMQAALPTINLILNGGGQLIIMSHLGRPKGEVQDKYSLKHILPHLSMFVGKGVRFAQSLKDDQSLQCNMQNVDVM